MIMVREDILNDLYEAIEEFSNQMESVNSISDLRFGNILQLKDELKSGKRYTDVEKVYSIWINSDGDNTTLVEGKEPLKFGNGDIDPDCKEKIHTFNACSWEIASDYYNNWIMQNISIFSK